MIDIRTDKDLKDYPVLDSDNGKLYIYIMLNTAGKIKIGKTKNIQQRYLSLCGSNSAGDKIIQVYVSPSTYLYTLEQIMHNKLDRYRIPNTEWFYESKDQTGESLFNSAINELSQLFSSTCYKKCNDFRKLIHEKEQKGDFYDD